MVDSHCHLADPVFAPDLEGVVARAREAGLTHALCILAAGDADEWQRGQRLVALWPGARFACGVHPHQAGDFADAPDRAAAQVAQALDAEPAVRAVGEIGLDYHYSFSPREVQQTVFRAQLRLALERDRPVVIHTREAENDTVRILREEGSGALRGVLHCFTGTPALAEQALAIGFQLSFAGIVTFPKGENVRAIVRTVPDDRFLIETDSPFLAPVPHRGKRNEPAWVTHVAATIAAERASRIEDIVAATDANFSRLFRP